MHPVVLEEMVGAKHINFLSGMYSRYFRIAPWNSFLIIIPDLPASIHQLLSLLRFLRLEMLPRDPQKEVERQVKL